MLLVQMLLGYEWLMSGLSKVVRGGFLAALQDDMTFRSGSLGGWFGFLLDTAAIPNARVVAVIVVIGQLVLGGSLIVAALLWLLRWPVLADRQRALVLSVVIVAGAVAIGMNVAFHVYTGSTHPWLIAADPFGEGVDLDSLMPLIQGILAVVAFRYLRVIRHLA
jgi:hypothetical protein